MAQSHTHLPDIEDLQKHFDRVGLEEFCKHYSIYDFLMGRGESVRFVERKFEELKLKKQQEDL